METQDNVILYEYAVVRYVPRVDREEFMNIGLIMMCKRSRWLSGRVEIDERRISTFDPSVDLERLEEQASMFMRQDVPSAELPAEERYRWLSAVKSGVLQVSCSHPGLIPTAKAPTQDEAFALLNGEFDRLFADLVTV